jgi:hypothetical protein
MDERAPRRLLILDQLHRSEHPVEQRERRAGPLHSRQDRPPEARGDNPRPDDRAKQAPGQAWIQRRLPGRRFYP